MSEALNGICREDFAGGTIITIRDASLPVVRWVAAAGGQVVPELDCRHGRRLAKRKVRRKVSRKSRSALR